MVKKYLLIRDNERDFAARLINRLNELYGEIDILIIYEDEAAGFGEDELFVFSEAMRVIRYISFRRPRI